MENHKKYSYILTLYQKLCQGQYVEKTKNKNYIFYPFYNKKRPAALQPVRFLLSVCDRIFMYSHYFVALGFLFRLSKYNFVSATTTPFKAIRAIRFGNAIRPFTISAIVHTALTVM